MAARPASSPSLDRPRRLGGGVGRPLLHPGQLAVEERLALRRGHRDRHDGLHVGQRRAGPGQEALLHVEDDLALDQEVVVEGERVLGQAHGAVDGVLDRRRSPGPPRRPPPPAARRGWWRRSTSSAAARSAWLSSACSVNVPGGPRKPTRTPGGRSGTGWQDSEVDAERPAGIAGRRGRRAGRPPTTPPADWSACPSPTSATPASTTTGPCARACPRRSTARARPPRSAPAS